MISLDKQYQTRDGRPVRIYRTDAGGPHPVHGAHLSDFQGGMWLVCAWAADGKACWSDVPATARGQEMTAFDLIEVKPKITRTYWLVHDRHEISRAYQAGQTYGGGHSAEEYAKLRTLNPNVVAITGPHTVEFTEGEGL